MTNGTIEQKAVVTITPAVNIVETPEAFVVAMDIPGAVKDRISANIEDHTLLITADVPEESGTGNDHPVKQYRREFSLANDIDVNSTEAQYNLGVLTITLKKKQQYVPKQIHIQ